VTAKTPPGIRGISLEDIEKTDADSCSVHAGQRVDGPARMQAAYGHAIESGYRFYSYGDASLLLP
jgi:hypothetical protein